MKKNWLAATGGGRLYLELLKSPLCQRIVIIWPFGNTLTISTHRACFYLTWPRTHSVQTALSLGHLSKTICNNCLIAQLPGVKPAGGNRGWPKIIKRKNGDWEFIGFLEYSNIPRNQECHLYMQDCVHAQETPVKVLISCFWLTLRFNASRK